MWVQSSKLTLRCVYDNTSQYVWESDEPFFFLQSNTQFIKHTFRLRKCALDAKEILKIYRSVLYSGVWNRGVSLYVQYKCSCSKL